MSEKKIICDSSKCTGCCACFNICPAGCITMKEDEFGFIRPDIDSSKCLNCNLCVKTCPMNNESEMKKAEKVFAVWNLDEEDRKDSASGGIATILARNVVKDGGVAFGSTIDKSSLQIVHDCAQTNVEVDKFKGSKYVQSYIGDTYKRVKECLNENKKVIFFGTPCQVDGLNFYLKKKYENLVTVDLICHGVPSQKYLRDHIKEVSPLPINDLNKINFRGGESDFSFTLYKDKEIVYKKDRDYDLYFRGFLDSLFYRENCYSCRYSRPERVSDITIGDFWGLGLKKSFDRRGVKRISAALPNTEKGMAMFNKCSNDIFYEEREVEEAVSGNDNLQRASKKHNDYEKFRRLYVKRGFEKAAKSCLYKAIYRKKFRDIKYMTKMKIKGFLKKS